MADTAALEGLVARLDERVSRAEERAARAEERAARLEARFSKNGKRPVNGDARPRRVSRSGFLKAAGAAAAGAVGAALLEARGATDAYAITSDNNFVATGNPTGTPGSGGTAFKADSTGNFLYGLDVTALSNAVQAVSTSSNGIYAVGGGGGVSAFFDAGGRATLHLTGGLFAISGPPTTGTYYAGDIWVDVNNILWVCITGGSPGTFVPLQPGGYGTALSTTRSSLQYTLGSSDGTTWTDIDATGLGISYTPDYAVRAVITGNADLWTTKVGLNQDIGIFISGGAYGTGQLVAWKESGGFAAYAPNAAFVETVQPLSKGVMYTIKLQWKGNNPFSSPYLIVAGAGPWPPGGTSFSPTRLTVRGIAV